MNAKRGGQPDSTEPAWRTASGLPLQPSYGPEDHPSPPGRPGSYPFTRGIHESMYQGRLWTMRQFAGFGTPEETNQRFRYLLDQGQNGLSVAFDLPTLMGLDADAPEAEGEAGKCGVSISSIADMEQVFAGIPLNQVSVSMTINAPAAVIWAMYLVAAERQGVPWHSLRGTLQNDILKEYIAQKEFVFPPAPSLRLVTDTIEFGARHTPLYNPVSISGYHIREAGSTAVQELAFTLRDGLEYVEQAVARGLAIDEFAPRLSFFFDVHNDFFEEIAKFRAARRMWAAWMKERFGAVEEKSWKLRFHAQTAGCTLTWQQPYNNVVRTAYQALAGVIGGAQSLHTNSLDEAYALPGEHAATLALRTQQVIAYETGIPGHPDPFGGSWFVENLTDRMEQAAMEYVDAIDRLGGMVPAIEQSYPQREIARAAYEQQSAIESGRTRVVGVNCFEQEGEQPPPLLRIDRTAEENQRRRLREWRDFRDNSRVALSLSEICRAAEGEQNTMPAVLDAVRAGATVGEIMDAFKSVFGGWRETPAV